MKRTHGLAVALLAAPVLARITRAGGEGPFFSASVVQPVAPAARQARLRHHPSGTVWRLLSRVLRCVALVILIPGALVLLQRALLRAPLFRVVLLYWAAL